MATRALIRLPPVHALSAFEAAARHNSFAVAAEELCITPSALSHRIRLLEDHTGERLFNRDGRTVSLSEFGRRYLDVVRVALRTLSDFPLPHKKAISQPRVKITVPPTFTRCFLVPHLAEFTRLHPEIILEAFLSVPLYDLSLSETDLEVRFGTGEYQSQVAEKLFEEPVFAVANPRYLEQIGGLAEPADLKRATLLRSPLEPWQPWFEAAGLDWPEPDTGFRVDAEIATAVVYAAAFLPGRVRCLEQSIALYAMLRHEGFPARLRFGVYASPFRAHAWVELEGEPLNEVPESLDRFIPFPDFIS